MNDSRPLRIKPIAEIRNPNIYIDSMVNEYGPWTFTEAQAPENKGVWRSEVFSVANSFPMDLEIGTGNGFFFAHRARQYSQRKLLGLEIKFKPLVQSIRRALREGCENARMIRFHAGEIAQIFAKNELDNVFIHHPDPWEKRRWQKNRLIQAEYLETLFELQRSGSFLEFKTDHKDYFEWALKLFKQSPYKLEGFTYDLHNSEFQKNNFVTHFETIFLRKGQPIYYAMGARP